MQLVSRDKEINNQTCQHNVVNTERPMPNPTYYTFDKTYISPFKYTICEETLAEKKFNCASYAFIPFFIFVCVCVCVCVC